MEELAHCDATAIRSRSFSNCDPLMVIPGSDSYRYDLDAVTETFDNKDLNRTGGSIGFTGPTTFNVCHEVPVADVTAFKTFIGELETAALDRVLMARKHCW